jgi:hypothetical protein
MSISSVRYQCGRRTLIRPGWITSAFTGFGPWTKPGSSLTLLAAGLTTRRRPDQGLACIRPLIGMRVMGVVDLKIVRQTRVKIVGRSVIATLEEPPGQDTQPQLHLIQPGAMLGGKVQDMLMGRITQEGASLSPALQGLRNKWQRTPRRRRQTSKLQWVLRLSTTQP